MITCINSYLQEAEVISLCFCQLYRARPSHIRAVWPGSIPLADQLQDLILISLTTNKKVMINVKVFGWQRVREQEAYFGNKSIFFLKSRAKNDNGQLKMED